VRIDDPAYVREQYKSEQGLAARRSFYDQVEGPDAREVAFEAVAAVRPRRVLEVGPGPGEASERIARELGAEVVAIDISERMVELARARGVDARVGDVQALDFDDGSFDCVLAAWVLFHVGDLDRGLSELARVLCPGGRLVAVTVSVRHLAELWELVGGEQLPLTFRRENGEELLRRHFATVERHDVEAKVTVQDAESVRRYLASSNRGKVYVDSVPELSEPLVVGSRTTVFVAETAS
jgi:ubiquinone/menaquinone biosynthesis C-methylase UbiE